MWMGVVGRCCNKWQRDESSIPLLTGEREGSTLYDLASGDWMGGEGSSTFWGGEWGLHHQGYYIEQKPFSYGFAIAFAL